MSTKNEFLYAMCIAISVLIVSSLAANNAISYAITPQIPDPSEGSVDIGNKTGDWNWGLSANITGNWSWKEGRPGHYGFDDWTWHAHRWGGPGVWCIGDLQMWYKNDTYQGFTEDNVDNIYVTGTGDTHMLNTTAKSYFQNLFYETWWRSVTIQTSV